MGSQIDEKGPRSSTQSSPPPYESSPPKYSALDRFCILRPLRLLYAAHTLQSPMLTQYSRRKSKPTSKAFEDHKSALDFKSASDFEPALDVRPPQYPRPEQDVKGLEQPDYNGEIKSKMRIEMDIVEQKLAALRTQGFTLGPVEYVKPHEVFNEPLMGKNVGIFRISGW